MLDLLKFATQNAREEFGGGTITGVTHWIDDGCDRLGHQEQALCGQFVEPDLFSTEPTCEHCQRRMTEIERMLFV